MRSITLAVSLCFMAAAAAAQQTGSGRVNEAVPPELTRDGIERFMEATVNTYLETSGVPGMTVAVVKGGEELLVRGYGFADVENRIPVDGATSSFRVGSVSKTVIATAVP